MDGGAFVPRIAGVLFLSLLLAGCAGARAKAVDPEAAFVQPVGFTDATGSVRGHVVDEEFLPLANAIVGFIDPYQATKTNAAGEFEIGLLDKLGERNLYVIHMGHKSDGKRILLKAGEAIEVTFVLPVLPIEGPWVQLVHRVGNFSNAVRIDPGWSTQSIEHEWRLSDKVEALQAVQMDARWSQASSLSGGLSVTLGLGGRAADDTFFTAEGRSPLVQAVARPDIEAALEKSETTCVKDPCTLRLSSVPATRMTNQFFDFGVIPAQRFDVWVSHFYRMEMPTGYAVP